MESENRAKLTHGRRADPRQTVQAMTQFPLLVWPVVSGSTETLSRSSLKPTGRTLIMIEKMSICELREG